MRTWNAVGAMMVVAVLAAGCSGGGSGSSAAPDEEASRKVPSLPVGPAFGKPAWGVQLPADENADGPLVTADRVVVLTGNKLHAYDAAGKQAWTAEPAKFEGDDRVEDSNAYPLLRQISKNVVAVIDAGSAKGEGLSTDTQQTKVSLYNLADGKLVKEVTIPGSKGRAPTISKIGLAFVSPNGATVTSVRSDGTTEQTPLNLDEPNLDDATEDVLTIGDVTVTRAGDRGYVFPTWNTAAKSPVAKPSATTIGATDNDDLVVVSWHRSEAFQQPAESGTALLRVSTGELVAKLDCTTDTLGPFTASPNGKHLVRDGLRIDTSGKADCIGGGEGEKSVDLTAVTDDGRAFGDAAGDLLVDVPADGEPKTAPRNGAKLPIGIMKGNIAVHWDSDTGVLTGNPLA